MVGDERQRQVEDDGNTGSPEGGETLSERQPQCQSFWSRLEADPELCTWECVKGMCVVFDGSCVSWQPQQQYDTGGEKLGYLVFLF